MDPYLKLAKDAIDFYIKTGKILPLPEKLPKEMLTRKAGVFVSIHKKLPRPYPPPKELKRKIKMRPGEVFDGLEPPSPIEELRGCIGTFLPTKENIGHEIVANAISAATSDPRFPPVSEKELPNLIYSVDVLSPPKKLDAKRYNLDPKHYGLIVSTPDGRRGLLLPDIPGIETPEEQFQICCLKAGISPEEKVILQIFTVERHAEK